LNLAVSTVSKAINNSPEISKSTKAKVQNIALLYNYTPNKLDEKERKLRKRHNCKKHFKTGKNSYSFLKNVVKSIVYIH